MYLLKYFRDVNERCQGQHDKKHEKKKQKKKEGPPPKGSKESTRERAFEVICFKTQKLTYCSSFISQQWLSAD